MFDLALPIANITEKNCTKAEIIRIFSMNKFFLSKADERIGFAQYFMEDGNYVSLVNNDLSKNIAQRIEEQSGIKSTINYISPKDKNYNQKLWEVVQIVQSKIMKWIDYFIENKAVNSDMIRDFLKDYPCQLYLSEETDDAWQPNIDMVYNSSCLSSAVISKDFIETLFRGRGELFQRIRKCSGCNHFFYAVDIRKVFCSVKCRNKIMYERRVQN